MSNWHTVLAEGAQGVAAAAQLAMRGYEVRLLCNDWDPFEYADLGPGLDVFWMNEKEVACLEPISGPLIPASHCDIIHPPFKSDGLKGKDPWVPVLCRKDRLERQIGLILDASGDVCADVCVEGFESESGRVSACLLDTGRHHIGTRLWVDASPRRVRRWGQSVMELTIGDFIERVEIQLTYPIRAPLDEPEVKRIEDLDVHVCTPSLWPGLSGWMGFETVIFRCPRRHRLTLLSPLDLYATIQEALGLRNFGDMARLYVDERPVGVSALHGALSAYQAQLHSVGIEPIHSASNHGFFPER